MDTFDERSWTRERSSCTISVLPAYPQSMTERINNRVPRKSVLHFEDGRTVDYSRYLGSFPFSQADQDALDSGRVFRCQKRLQLHSMNPTNKEDIIGCYISNAGTNDLYRITSAVSDLNEINGWTTTFEIVKDGKQYPLSDNIVSTLTRLSEALQLNFQPNDLIRRVKMEQVIETVLDKKDQLLQSGAINQAEIDDLEYYIRPIERDLQ